MTPSQRQRSLCLPPASEWHGKGECIWSPRAHFSWWLASASLPCTMDGFLSQEVIYPPCAQCIWRTCQNNTVLLCKPFDIGIYCTCPLPWFMTCLVNISLQVGIYNISEAFKSVCMFLNRKGIFCIHSLVFPLPSTQWSPAKWPLWYTIHSLLQERNKKKDAVRLRFLQSYCWRTVNKFKWIPRNFPAGEASNGKHGLV